MKAFAIVITIVLTLSAAIPSTFATGMTLRASQRRCERTAGRELERCRFVHDSEERLRFRHSRFGYTRGHTARESRHVSKNRPARDIRRIGAQNYARLRTHNRDGGRARRQLQRRMDVARNKCTHLKDTQKRLCVRSHLRNASRGETR